MTLNRLFSNNVVAPILVAIAILLTGPGLAQDSEKPTIEVTGNWQVAVLSPGGPISFGLELEKDTDTWTGFLRNGPERIKVPRVEVNDQNVSLIIDHYDSIAKFELSDQPTLTGSWRKRRGQGWIEMDLRATRSGNETRHDDPSAVLGTWSVKFEKSEDPAVAIFKKQGQNNRVLGTFLTTTGDYRIRDGFVQDDSLTLSCFDGAHAFLFKARLNQAGELNGDFWSSNTWHEAWTARKDENARLPDAFTQTKFTGDSDWGKLRFPSLDGKPMRLNDPQFAGKARLIYVFGSWCPNCHDAADYFAELQEKYGSRGLTILGLAFEMTGDFERDANQVRKYLKRHQSSYPVLIAGLSDKKAASKSLPILDRVRSYPTTIFVDGTGTVRGVHTGFSGPATGEAYEELKVKFESLIEKMLEDD